MNPAIRNTLVGLTAAAIAAGAMTSTALRAQQSSGAAAAAPAKKIKGGAQPWPDEKTIEARKVSSQNRKLFTSDDVLPISMTADFKAINNDKNQNSTKIYPGTITFAGPDGQPKTVQINLQPRGHSRRTICNWVPLRLTFPKEGVKGTVFDGVEAIKLGVHCRSDVDDIIMREYAVYRIGGLISPTYFRARPAKATYIDVKSGKPMESDKNAMFIEDDDDVARRMGGRITDAQGLSFSRVDFDSVATQSMFEYMISNHDFGLTTQHNVRVVEMQAGPKYVIPYDFDYSGVVDAPYAIPPPQLHLTSVKDRMYRGPCRPAAEMEPILAKFRNARAQILAIYDTVPNLKNGYRADAKKYLETFFKSIENPGSVKKEFTDCKYDRS